VGNYAENVAKQLTDSPRKFYVQNFSHFREIDFFLKKLVIFCHFFKDLTFVVFQKKDTFLRKKQWQCNLNVCYSRPMQREP